MRAIGYFFLGCVLLSGMERLASADIFKCQIKGKVVFQNHPCGSEEGTQPHITHREAPAPPPTLVPLTAPVVVPPAQTLAIPTPLPAVAPPPPAAPGAFQAPGGSQPPSVEVPKAKAVDTTQLALIRPGMTMYEVEKRLGKPESVYDRGWTWSRGQLLRQTDWVYPSLQASVPPALVRFVGDQVSSTGRIQ